MSGRPPPDLAARLRAHVPRRFVGAGPSWWAPPDQGGLPARAMAVEQLALLVASGRSVQASVAVLRAEHPHRPGRSDRLDVPAERLDVLAKRLDVPADRLDVLADRLDAGAAVPDAVRWWARACGCAELGALATELQLAVGTDQVVAALDVAASRLRRRADDALAARAVWRGRVVVAVAMVTSAASAALVLS